MKDLGNAKHIGDVQIMVGNLTHAQLAQGMWQIWKIQEI
jgi:hypothetical protein